MAIDKRLAAHRILFYRSFYPNPVPAGSSREKDDRMKHAFDLMAAAGLDTQNSFNLRPSENRLSHPDTIKSLGFLRQFEGTPCALFLWTREDESEVVGFFERLMRTFPDPVSGSPLIWFCETPGKTFLRLTGPEGNPLFLLSMAYRSSYTDVEIKTLQRFLTIRRTASATIEAPETEKEIAVAEAETDDDLITELPPPPEHPDATVRVPAMKDVSFIQQLTAASKRQKPGT